MSCAMMLILQRPLTAGVAVVAALLYMAVDLLIARRSRGTGGDTPGHKRRTVGRARVLLQSAPHVLAPPVLWHNQGSMPNAEMARMCCRGTGF